MVIFHSYVSLPEGKPPIGGPTSGKAPIGRQLVEALKQLPRELRIDAVCRGAEDRGAVEAWNNGNTGFPVEGS